MDFLKRTDLINTIVQEIVYAIIPQDWRKIVYYTERLRDKNVGLRNKSTVKCWIGNEMKLYTKSLPLSGGAELFDVIESLFLECEKTRENWCGLSITINSSGKYSSKFYYEGTPLLHSNDDELNERLIESEQALID